MSTSEMDRLVADISHDPTLQSLFGGAQTIEQAVSAAQDAGYDVGADGAQVYLAQMQGAGQAELTDTQLDTVAGGKKGPSYGVLLNF